MSGLGFPAKYPSDISSDQPVEANPKSKLRGSHNTVARRGLFEERSAWPKDIRDGTDRDR